MPLETQWVEIREHKKRRQIFPLPKPQKLRRQQLIRSVQNRWPIPQRILHRGATLRRYHLFSLLLKVRHLTLISNHLCRTATVAPKEEIAAKYRQVRLPQHLDKFGGINWAGARHSRLNFHKHKDPIN